MEGMSWAKNKQELENAEKIVSQIGVHTHADDTREVVDAITPDEWFKEGVDIFNEVKTIYRERNIGRDTFITPEEEREYAVRAGKFIQESLGGDPRVYIHEFDTKIYPKVVEIIDAIHAEHTFLKNEINRLEIEPTLSSLDSKKLETYRQNIEELPKVELFYENNLAFLKRIREKLESKIQN